MLRSQTGMHFRGRATSYLGHRPVSAFAPGRTQTLMISRCILWLIPPLHLSSCPCGPSFPPATQGTLSPLGKAVRDIIPVASTCLEERRDHFHSVPTLSHGLGIFPMSSGLGSLPIPGSKRHRGLKVSYCHTLSGSPALLMER